MRTNPTAYVVTCEVKIRVNAETGDAARKRAEQTLLGGPDVELVTAKETELVAGSGFATSDEAP